MATLRPTLQQIIDRVHNDSVARLTTDELRRSDLTVFERVIAGVSHGLYSAIEYGRKQLFSDTADTSFLERQASIFGLARRQATKAIATVQFEFANGLVNVPVGTLIQNDSGYQYQTTSALTSEGICTVRALLAGSAYNPQDNAEFTLPSPIAGVLKAKLVQVTTQATDVETDDDLRARVLSRTQNPPRQGTKTDYVAWVQEVEGVGKAWCYPKEDGDGTVTVRFVDTNGDLPDGTLVDKVQAYLNTKTNVLATNYVVSPIAQPFNFTLKIYPDNLSNRELAEKAIKELFKKESMPGGTIYLSHINAVLSAISTEDNHIIVEPTTDIVADSTSYLPTVGDITWQADQVTLQAIICKS